MRNHSDWIELVIIWLALALFTISILSFLYVVNPESQYFYLLSKSRISDFFHFSLFRGVLLQRRKVQQLFLSINSFLIMKIEELMKKNVLPMKRVMDKTVVIESSTEIRHTFNFQVLFVVLSSVFSSNL